MSDYYPADEIALEVLAQDSTIEVQDDLTILSPSYPTDTAVIFYPGAKVEAEAYLPLLEQIRQTGVICILVHMPFRMAIFDANAAEEVMEQFPDIQHWYIAGHSMGGAMASRFAAGHPDEVDGLILLGAYIYGDYPPEKTLTVYGSLNQSVEGPHRLHGERCGDRGRQPRPVRQLRPPEGGPARDDLRGGAAGPDGGRHRGVSRGGRRADLRRDTGCFSGKRRETRTYDRETQAPVIHASICTGEKVAGFRDLRTGRFTEIMLIRNPRGPGGVPPSLRDRRGRDHHAILKAEYGTEISEKVSKKKRVANKHQSLECEKRYKEASPLCEMATPEEQALIREQMTEAGSSDMGPCKRENDLEWLCTHVDLSVGWKLETP